MHVLIAPTYGKKARKPSRQRKAETEEQFAARIKAAAEKDEVRTVGRASHGLLKIRGSFALLRKSLALAVADLGIEYGEDRTPDAPRGISTVEWVHRKTVSQRDMEQDDLAQALAIVTLRTDPLVRAVHLRFAQENFTRLQASR